MSLPSAFRKAKNFRKAKDFWANSTQGFYNHRSEREKKSWRMLQLLPYSYSTTTPMVSVRKDSAWIEGSVLQITSYYINK